MDNINGQRIGLKCLDNVQEEARRVKPFVHKTELNSMSTLAGGFCRQPSSLIFNGVFERVVVGC